VIEVGSHRIDPKQPERLWREWPVSGLPLTGRNPDSQNQRSHRLIGTPSICLAIL
jgi:hypothetical protein